MGKILKSRIFLCIVTTIIVSSLSVYAATLITADQVSYKDKSLDEAMDVLYDRSSNLTKFCKLIGGNFGEVSSKYECDPGDGIKKNFYLLAYNSDNNIELIMERNITDTLGSERTMTWNNAMKFFRTGAGKNIPSTWKNVMDVDLPKAQSIVDAVGRSSWIASDNGEIYWCFGSKRVDVEGDPWCTNSNQSTYAWLFNHLINCKPSGCTDDSGATAYAYWTRDLISNTAKAWGVDRGGDFGTQLVSNSTDYGVRPVITVLKSNLYQ